MEMAMQVQQCEPKYKGERVHNNCTEWGKGEQVWFPLPHKVYAKIPSPVQLLKV